MLAYSILGTNNAEKSLAFYDALLAEIGGKRALEVNRVTFYAGENGTPLFGIAEPANGEPASVGNGTMLALSAASPEEVNRLYKRAIELGATDDGAPGPRENKGFEFYAGYFRDLNGNKLSFFSA